MNQLEFEIRPCSVRKNQIVYDVYRKGLCVGVLFLEEPYNLESAIMESLVMSRVKVLDEETKKVIGLAKYV